MVDQVVPRIAQQRIAPRPCVVVGGEEVDPPLGQEAVSHQTDVLPVLTQQATTVHLHERARAPPIGHHGISAVVAPVAFRVGHDGDIPIGNHVG